MKIRALLTASALLLAVPLWIVPASTAGAVIGCETGVKSDFNGDGWSDAVVGDPMATVNGLPEAGQVIVLYGDLDAKVGGGPRDVLWQGTKELAGVAEAGDRFGTALAVADLNCDDFTDLVVGTPLEDINGQTDSGYAQVVWGASTGLGTVKPDIVYTQTSFGQTVVAGDHFGYAVDAVEDVGQGGTPSPSAFVLAIGVPGANVAGHSHAGAIAIRAPLDGGNVAFWITQNTNGIPGAAEAGDRFGAAVSCNYLSGDSGLIDCALGAPNEDIGSKKDAGGVTVVQDIYDPDELSGVSLDQNAAGVPGKSEAGDFYGRSLDTVLVGSTSRIAVGAPGENLGPDSNAGLVQLFRSNTKVIDPGTALTQDTPGVADSTQSGDAFGDEVAWLAPGLGDAQTRLAVSAPKENTTGGADTGLVQIFPMNNLASDVVWTQDSPGVPGSADDGDQFGATLSTVAGYAERVVLVGVPDDSAFTTGMVNVIPMGGGSPRQWAPGVNVPAAGASRFGGSLGGVSGGAG